MKSHTVPTKTYVGVWAALLLLLFATAAVDYFDLGVFNTILAFTFALIKALLILLIFMHVRYSSKLTWVFAIAGFVWLGILFTLLGDFVSRPWLPVPGH